jgi:hypothetical protein
MSVKISIARFTDPLSGLESALHIDQAINGKEKNCSCYKCPSKLTAVNGRGMRKILKQHHFRHPPDSQCVGAPETEVHELAKQIIRQSSSIVLPTKSRFNYVDSELEVRLQQVVFDAFVSAENSDQLGVEVAVTSFSDELKCQRLKEIGIPTIEIDLSEVPRQIDLKRIEFEVLYNPENRKYLYQDSPFSETASNSERESVSFLYWALSVITKYPLQTLGIILGLILFFKPRRRRW